MPPSSTPNNTGAILDAIVQNGYAVVDQFLAADTIAALANNTLQHYGNGTMRPAATGLHAAQAALAWRGDSIQWLEEATDDAAEMAYLQAVEALRQALNAALYLGLFSLESHYAVYPPGAGYRRHLDQFAENQARQVSLILYLNPAWQSADGGELRLYLDENDTLDISPLGGRLVLFLSGRFWHEVLPASRQRLSLTGWLRRRNETAA